MLTLLQMSPTPPLWFPLHPAPAPHPLHHTVVCVHGLWMYVCVSFGWYLSVPSALPFSQLSVSSVYPCLWFYFVSLFCSLDSTYEWDHMVFSFSNCSLSVIISRSIHTVAKGKSSFFFFFWPMCRIPLCKWTTAFQSTHLLVGSWAVPMCPSIDEFLLF